MRYKTIFSMFLLVLTFSGALFLGIENVENVSSTSTGLFSNPQSSETPVQTTSEDESVDLQKDLEAYWRFDDSKVSRGYSLEFDDSDDYVEVEDNGDSPLDVDQLSFSAWIKTNGTSTGNIVMNKENTYELAAGTNGISMAVATENCGGWCSNWAIEDAGTIEAGKWVFVAGTWNGSHMRVYENSTLLETYVQSNAGKVTETDRNLGIGARDIDQIPHSLFEGSIDNPLIYNQTLTQSEIQEIYQNKQSNFNGMVMEHRFDEGPDKCYLPSENSCLEDKSGRNTDGIPRNFSDNKLNTGSGWQNQTPVNRPSVKDYSGNSNAGQLFGANTGELNGFDFNESSGWATGLKGGAIRLSGLGQSENMTVPHSASLNIKNEITLATWVKHDNSFDQNANNNYRGILEKRGAYRLLVEEDGRVTGSVYIDGNRQFNDAGDVPIDQWSHIAYTYVGDTGEWRVYIDGEKVGFGTGAKGRFDTNARKLVIGSEGPNHNWKGKIDDVKTYQKAFSESEIKSLYEGNDMRRGLVGEWKFGEGNRGTAYDTSGLSKKGILGTKSTGIGANNIQKKISVNNKDSLSQPKDFSISTWIKPEKSDYFFEGFESGTMDAPLDNVDDWRVHPEGWKLDVSNHDSDCEVPCYDNGGDPGVVSAADKPDFSFINDIPNGTYALYLRHTVTATSPSLDLSRAEYAEVSGYWKGLSQDGQNEHTSLEVHNGSAWTKINCIEGSNDGVINNSLCSAEDDGDWHHFSNNITSHINQDFKIRFTGSPGSYDYSLIDNVKVRAPGARISSFGPAVIKGGNGDFGTYSLWASPSKVFGALGSPTEAWNKTNETGIYGRGSKDWQNVVMTFDDSQDTVKLYVDGELVNKTDKVGKVPLSQKELRIGNRFKGKVDEVRFYNRTLSKREIGRLSFR